VHAFVPNFDVQRSDRRHTSDRCAAVNSAYQMSQMGPERQFETLRSSCSRAISSRLSLPPAIRRGVALEPPQRVREVNLNPLPYGRLMDLQHDNDAYPHQIGFIETRRAHDWIESRVRGT